MTRREEIIKLISERKWSAKQLANHFETQDRAINDDLEHISKSLKKRFQTIPALCKKCGYRFQEREKKKKPSRCPKCKNEWIEAPLFFIE